MGLILGSHTQYTDLSLNDGTVGSPVGAVRRLERQDNPTLLQTPSHCTERNDRAVSRRLEDQETKRGGAILELTTKFK